MLQGHLTNGVERTQLCSPACCQKLKINYKSYFKLVVGHMTEQMKNGRSCDIKQMTQCSEWDMKILQPQVEYVTRGRSTSVTFSTEGRHNFLSYVLSYGQLQ